MDAFCDIAVVGGGAAGLAAAIAASCCTDEEGCSPSVAIIESSDRVGRTILKTGNGRCNFTNEHAADENALYRYRNSAFVREAFESLAQQRGGDNSVLEFFENLGLEWRQEGEGRRYPLANKASVVVDVLRAEASRLGVREVCNSPVASIVPPTKPGSPFTIHLRDGVLWRARKVVVACGGRGIAAVDVASMVPGNLQPVLGPIRCTDASCAFTRELDNIRVRCNVLLARPERMDPSCRLQHLRAEEGELLFRAYGVSGICVFDLSRLAQPADMLFVNFIPSVQPDQVRDYLASRRKRLEAHSGPLACGRFLQGLVLPRVADVVLKASRLDEDALLSDESLEVLAKTLSAFPLEVAGIGPEDQCQVHRGGLPVDEFDPCTLEARDVPGLFACGEALDVDGPCGGYNLHWAWASGLLAGACAGGRE